MAPTEIIFRDKFILSPVIIIVVQDDKKGEIFFPYLPLH